MKNLTILTIILFLFSACKKDINETPELDTFAKVIANGGDFPTVSQSQTATDTSASTQTINGEEWNCTTVTYDAMSAGGGNNGFPLFNPNASVIYPGSLLQGNSLKQATPNVIAVERAGGTISYDLINGNNQSYFEVDVVKKSTIQNAMNQIIANSPPDLPANFTFNYSQVQSEQALALSLGIDYNSAFVDVSSDFSFSSGSNLNRILVKLNQSFYTMSFDIPTNDAGFFAPGVTPADLAQYVGPGNPAAFISDVTYGRIYYMLIESSSSYTEMESSVNASFSGVVSSASADIDGSSLSSLDELKIKVMAFGGDATSTLLTVGETDLGNLIDLLAESTTISAGVPISYVVRSVLTKQIVSVQLATQYDVTECYPASAGGAPAYTAHWTGNVLSAMGPVGAAFSGEGTTFYLISQNGSEYMVSNIGTLDGPFPISNLGTGDMPFPGVGAACRMDGNHSSVSRTMVMDMTGSLFSYLNSDGSWSTDAEPIANLAGGYHPFNLNGIGAIAFRDQDIDGSAQRYMFNRNGDQYSLYSSNPGQFATAYPVSQWANDEIPFANPKVSAAIGFHLGQDRYYILFDYAGTHYAVSYYIGNGQFIFLGPFDL